MGFKVRTKKFYQLRQHLCIVRIFKYWEDKFFNIFEILWELFPYSLIVCLQYCYQFWTR